MLVMQWPLMDYLKIIWQSAFFKIVCTTKSDSAKKATSFHMACIELGSDEHQVVDGFIITHVATDKHL